MRSVKYEFRRIFPDLFNNSANVGDFCDGIGMERTDIVGCQLTMSESALSYAVRMACPSVPVMFPF